MFPYESRSSRRFLYGPVFLTGQEVQGYVWLLIIVMMGVAVPPVIVGLSILHDLLITQAGHAFQWMAKIMTFQ
ncbi:MAG: hypothetical protein Q8L77_03570 [Nitrospirota bacterium]|nr:hypothetical protein [Nitrospirota bacterium]